MIINHYGYSNTIILGTVTIYSYIIMIVVVTTVTTICPPWKKIRNKVYPTYHEHFPC